VNLSDGRVTTIPAVRSFRLPRDNGTWLAYVTEADSAAAAADSAARGARSAGARRVFGSPLVVRNLSTGAEERLPDVLAYSFDDAGTVLAYTVVSRDSTRDGAYVRSMPGGATVTLASGRGNYKALALDSAARQVAFLSDRDEFGRDKARYTLYYAQLKGNGAQPAVAPAALATDYKIQDAASVSFTRTGNAILFGVAPVLPDSVPADSLSGKAVFDLWHYKDPVLQPTQRLGAARERNRAFQAIYFPATKKLVQLGSDSIPTLDVSDDGRIGLAASRERYRIETMWGDGGSDVYIIDPQTGTPKLIREKISGQAQLSPEGKFAAFYDTGHWYSYNVLTGKTVDLTGPVTGVSFEQETWDTPSTPAAWGLGGWTKGDKSVLLYDRWDVWEFDPTGVKPAVMVTDSVGRSQQIVLRLVQVRRGRAAPAPAEEGSAVVSAGTSCGTRSTPPSRSCSARWTKRPRPAASIATSWAAVRRPKRSSWPMPPSALRSGPRTPTSGW
jgi:hypothetical protein